MILLQLGFTYLPFLNNLFHTTPIGLDSWARIAAAADVAHFVVGLEKFMANRLSVTRNVLEAGKPESL